MLAERMFEDRELYKFVGEIISYDCEKSSKITQELFSNLTGLDTNYYSLYNEKIHCKLKKGAVIFCEKAKKDNTYVVKQSDIEDITQIIPFNFTENIIRIYSKKKENFEDCKIAFKKFCKEIGEIAVE